MKKIYIVATKSYDYFDYNGRYHGNESKQFDNLTDAWAEYKNRHDYNYGDSFHFTYKPVAVWIPEQPIHNIHGQRFGHKPTIEEKLRRAVDDALTIWSEANEIYRDTFDKYGYWHPKTNEARIKAEDLWEKIEEAEAERDEYLNPTTEYDNDGIIF